jgi:predicted  nucleic acid-binding Zn-ribbon protein
MAQKQLTALEALERECSAVDTEIAAAEANLPSLEQLRVAMDVACRAWLLACENLETQRISNEAAITPLREKRGALTTHPRADIPSVSWDGGMGDGQDRRQILH